MNNREIIVSQYVLNTNEKYTQKNAKEKPGNQIERNRLQSSFFNWRLLFWEQNFMDGSCIMTHDAAKLFRTSTKSDNFPACLFGSGVLSEEAQAAFRQANDRLLAGETHLTFEAVINDPDQHPRWMEIEYCLDADEDGIPAYAIGTAHDISEIKLAEVKRQAELAKTLEIAEQASLAKSEFLSRISHEIRTPINAISGLAELTRQTLKNDALCPRERETEVFSFSAEISASTKYLLSIVNDILDTAKIESGKMELHPEPFEMPVCLETIRTIVTPLAETKGIRFLCDDSGLLNHQFIGDRTRIQQIIMNILNNAIKFTPTHGTVTFTLKEEMLDTSLSQLSFEIKDNGCGMSEDFQKTMFDPFTQEYDNRIANSTGTGLGLSISRQLARMMNGDIVCQSTKKEGTTFTVHIQLPAISDESEENLIEKQDMNWNFNELHVLVCEDHPVNQKITRRLLENKGCLVDTADNGQIAVEKFQASDEGFYKIILMDIRMPVMDGLTATRKIRTLPRKDARDVIIIAMSANAYEIDLNDSMKAGMNRHLSKPVDARLMYQTMKEFLTRKIR